MARISAGIACSHVPAIGAAIDLGKTKEPYWVPLFAGFEFTKQWMAANTPDVVFLVYNDHATAFSLEIIPTFAIGCAAEFAPADEGWGARPVPVVRGAPEFAAHIAASVIESDFDLTIVNRMISLGGNIYFLAKIFATDGRSFQYAAALMTGMSQEDSARMMLDGGRKPKEGV